MAVPPRRAVLLAAGLAVVLADAGESGSSADGERRLQQPIIELHAALEAAMRAGRGASFANRFNALAPVIERVFDLDTVLKLSIGMRWASFDKRTQERLAGAFHQFAIATYVSNYDKYDGEKFEILSGVRASGSDRIVPTEVTAEPVGRMRLDYVMRNFGAAWRVVDVLIDGSISRVAVQRSDFRTILANGDAEALIRSLHHKVSDLSGGALSA